MPNNGLKTTPDHHAEQGIIMLNRAVETTHQELNSKRRIATDKDRSKKGVIWLLAERKHRLQTKHRLQDKTPIAGLNTEKPKLPEYHLNTFG
ncbi:hypothetical protein OAL35_02360 [bacterium]|nr:hypothetical protein [bacterium]